jgi:hypothetical protein
LFHHGLPGGPLGDCSRFADSIGAGEADGKRDLLADAIIIKRPCLGSPVVLPAPDG